MTSLLDLDREVLLPAYPEAYLVEVIEALRDPAMIERVAELTPAALAAARNAAGELKTA
jgi:hypothetical protein